MIVDWCLLANKGLAGVEPMILRVRLRVAMFGSIFVIGDFVPSDRQEGVIRNARTSI